MGSTANRVSVARRRLLLRAAGIDACPLADAPAARVSWITAVLQARRGGWVAIDLGPASGPVRVVAQVRGLVHLRRRIWVRMAEHEIAADVAARRLAPPGEDGRRVTDSVDPREASQRRARGAGAAGEEQQGGEQG